MRNNNALISSDVKGNAAQMEAILHTDGPAMVLAGPGSGKTFVIVQRLKNLILNEGINPSSILVITFTKAAAIEMQQRFMKLTDSSYPDVSFGTFHSIFYQIIRQSNPMSNQINLATESFKYRLLKEILQELRAKKLISEDELNEGIELSKEIISEISRIKNTMSSPGYCLDMIPCKRVFTSIYEKYNSMLTENNMIDFDDMILKCHELLSTREELLKMWQERFKYILIDEYQDINLIQYKVVKLLCPDGNLFVVGDDDQSIYGFRGSDPAIMQQFPTEYANEKLKVINLDRNYRCGKTILQAGLKVIDENTVRFKKVLEADDSNGPGYVIARRYINKEQQNKAIIKFLSERMDKLGEVAFIFRTNSQAYSMANVLKSAGIPTNLDDFAKTLTDSEAVKLCQAYLSFIYLGKKREHFYKIMNKPLRFISREAAKNETVTEAEILRFYNGNIGKQKEVQKFFRQLNMLSKMRPSLTIRFLRNEIGIDKLYPAEIDALNELTELAIKTPDNRLLLKALDEIRNSALESGEKKKTNKKGNMVKLMTMHGSKGLEFEVVWLPGLNEGIIPSRSATTLAQIEEERRMLYVAMTRAKTALIMSYLTGSEENPMLPSRFLRPIKDLWSYSSPSRPSSGSSTISSNSTSSR